MHKKEKEAIAFLRSAAEHARKQGRKLTLGFSAGKDSVVIYHLAVRAGIEFEAIHSVTTVDPPGTLKFIRENYPNVKIKRSYLTFYSLVEQKGTPGRMKRFCCEHLKERSGIGKLFINGSRAEEGSDRSLREPEWCDTRKYMKGCKHYFPILNWSLQDVWDYIYKYELPYIMYYTIPYFFKRHGCVACPLAGPAQMRKEYRIFPKHARRMIKALQKYLDTHRHTVTGNTFDNGQEFFYYYTHKLSIAQFKEMKRQGFDFEEANRREIFIERIKRL